MVTIPRALMIACNLLPGDFLELKSNPDGSITFRPWEARENATRQSPGVIPESPALALK